eukprot:CAMPEP_0179268462 /NCGR_PEP_ID=MMETSP0797-20121207/30454_1 /TAXON_ID=47934 /ORGANISM="Dinophysis acuminata, Strain DAEP01" /LENGTH=74 /DNA_ID=CAMNT_0020976747 /DNA_START=95 /DNA_END=315 /DNA_ORIENTATION=+
MKVRWLATQSASTWSCPKLGEGRGAAAGRTLARRRRECMARHARGMDGFHSRRSRSGARAARTSSLGTRGQSPG